MSVAPGTDQARSIVAVPMLAGERMLGGVLLENHERDGAFWPDEVRLLETIAAGMAVALLNARSYEAERQRAAELAVINAVQQALAGELSLQGVYDAVGMKLREVFPKFGVSIRRYEATTGLLHFPFWWSDAEPQRDLSPMRPVGFGAEVLRTRRPLLVNENLRQVAARLGSYPLARDQAMPKAQLIVPMLVGGEVVGMIDLHADAHEHAFTEADLRLLETLAASMSVALENARLFDEVQRRGREATALAEVGRDLSSSLDLQAVLNGIASHAKDLLAANHSAIFLPAADGRSYRALVALGEAAEALMATAIEAGHGIIGSLLQSGAAGFINDTQADPRGVPLAGTEQARRRAADGGAARRRRGRRGAGRDGGVAQRRRAVRRARAGVPRRPVATGVGGAAQCTAVQRDARRARAADGERRDPAHHQRVAERHPAGVPRHRRQRIPAVQQLGRGAHPARGRLLPRDGAGPTGPAGRRALDRTRAARCRRRTSRRR